jgi:hypothetical protein
VFIWSAILHRRHICLRRTMLWSSSLTFLCDSSFFSVSGYCVADSLVPLFLQTLTPHLYTTNALIQPSQPTTHPLYEAPAQPVSEATVRDGGVGGTTDSSSFVDSNEHAAAAAASLQTPWKWITIAAIVISTILAQLQ